MVRIHQGALSRNEVLTSSFAVCSKEWLGFVSTGVGKFTLFPGIFFWLLLKVISGEWLVLGMHEEALVS